MTREESIIVKRDLTLVKTAIIEECAEIIQCICKIKRFGFHSYNPFVHNGPSNLDHLISELGDLLALISVLCNETSFSHTLADIHEEMGDVAIQNNKADLEYLQSNVIAIMRCIDIGHSSIFLCTLLAAFLVHAKRFSESFDKYDEMIAASDKKMIKLHKFLPTL